jgi:hypothetical protein
MSAALLGQWGVEMIIASYPLNIDGLELISQEKERYFYRNRYAWGDQVQLNWEGPNRVTQILRTDKPVYTITNVPGWQRLDGEPIPREKLSLPAESGTFVYRPRGVWIGLGITLSTYLACALGLILSRRRKGG